jgi:hypothetical protein
MTLQWLPDLHLKPLTELQDGFGNNEGFGDKVVLFGGDFRLILPVVLDLRLFGISLKVAFVEKDYITSSYK